MGVKGLWFLTKHSDEGIDALCGVLRGSSIFERRQFGEVFPGFLQYKNSLGGADEPVVEKFLDLQKAPAAAFFSVGHFQRDGTGFASKQGFSQAFNE
jgi:hypothetical protein